MDAEPGVSRSGSKRRQSIGKYSLPATIAEERPTRKARAASKHEQEPPSILSGGQDGRPTVRGIATNVPVYLTFAAERSESEPGKQEIVCLRRTVEGSSVPQMCPRRWCGTHAFNTPESVRFRTREKMEAKPKCFPRTREDRAPEAACRRGAERVNFS